MLPDLAFPPATATLGPADSESSSADKETFDHELKFENGIVDQGKLKESL